MNSYNDFRDEQEQFETDADTKHEKTGAALYWFFLLVGVAISAGASYFIGHKGFVGNPFYERFIGAANAALLVVIALDGTFLALVWGMGSFLKTTEQRALAGKALVAIKAILCANIFAAFLLIQGAAVLPIVNAYTVYGSPLVIGATIWLWSSLYSRRRAGVMMATALNTQAQKADLWRKQYLDDEKRNRIAYDLAQTSPAMASLRNEAARRKAVADVAAEFGLTLAEAETLYIAAESHKAAQLPGASSFAALPAPRAASAYTAAPVDVATMSLAGTSPSISVSATGTNGWQVTIPGSSASFRVKQSGAGYGVYLRANDGDRAETYLCYLNAAEAAEAKGRELADFVAIIVQRIAQRQAKAKTDTDRTRLHQLGETLNALRVR